jgi:hypothetical protein
LAISKPIMIVFIADGSFCLVLHIPTILAQTMPSGAVHPIMPALVWHLPLPRLRSIAAQKVIAKQGVVDHRVKPGDECVREDALSTEWESWSCEVTTHVAEGNCVAARRGGEQPEANAQPVG